MKKSTLLFVFVCAILFSGQAQVELSYDNDEFTGWQDYVAETLFAVHFSPEGPCKIMTLKFYGGNDGPSSFYVPSVYNWEGSEPALESVYSGGPNLLAFEGWLEHDVEENLEMDGDFVVGFKPTDSWLSLAYDANLNTGRNWMLNLDDEEWTEVTEHAYLIRAVVQYPTGEMEELIGHTLNVHPNPSATSTTIEFVLAEPMKTKITIYNQYGAQVDRIEEFQHAGLQKIRWDVSDKSAGIYFFTLEAGKSSTSGKIVVGQ